MADFLDQKWLYDAIWVICNIHLEIIWQISGTWLSKNMRTRTERYALKWWVIHHHWEIFPGESQPLYCLVGGLEHEFYDFPYVGNNTPNWNSYFSEGLKPPSSCILICVFCFPLPHACIHLYIDTAYIRKKNMVPSGKLT